MSNKFQNTEPRTDDFTASAKPAVSLPSKIALDKKLFGISTAALLLGGATWTLLAQPDNPPIDPPVPLTPVPATPKLPVAGGTLLPHDVNVAHDVHNELSFSQAFAEAREDVGPGGLFIWQGKIYNTFTKEEWQNLSLVQRQEFLADVGYQPSTDASNTPAEKTPDPITIEGYLNGQRIVGLDFDHDGVIDTLVMEGNDGFTYRVVDATGDEGLDTLYQLDLSSNELVNSAKLDEPFMLSNADFAQRLEEAMTAEIMNSILEENNSLTPIQPTAEHNIEDDEMPYLEAENYDSQDSYVNNGDVSDMDES